MNTPEENDFNSLLKEFREREGLMQKELAKELGCNRNTIGNWEAGTSLPNDRDIVLQIGGVLGLTSEEVDKLLQAFLMGKRAKEQQKTIINNGKLYQPDDDGRIAEKMEDISSQENLAEKTEGTASQDSTSSLSNESGSPASQKKLPRRTVITALAIGGGGLVGAWSTYKVFDLLARHQAPATSTAPQSQTPTAATTTSKGWRPVNSSLIIPRDILGLTSFTLSNGRHQVLVAGGGKYAGVYFADCEIFDLQKEIWTKTGNLHDARTGHTSTLLPNSGKILVAGGLGGTEGVILDSAELYDPITTRWTQTSAMNQQRTTHAAVQLGNDRVLVVGGWAGGADPASNLKSAEIYEYNNGQPFWTPTADMMVGRQLPGCVSVPYKNGMGVLVTGGFNSSPLVGLRETELYDPQTQTWISLAPMHVGRWGFGMLWLQSIKKVLVVGGLTYGTSYSDAQFAKSAELYDIERDQWTMIHDMRYERGAYDGSSNAVLLKDGTVLVVGDDMRGPGTSEVFVPNPSNPDASKWNPYDYIGRPDGHSILLEDTGQILFVGRDFTFIYTP